MPGMASPAPDTLLPPKGTVGLGENGRIGFSLPSYTRLFVEAALRRFYGMHCGVISGNQHGG